MVLLVYIAGKHILYSSLIVILVVFRYFSMSISYFSLFSPFSKLERGLVLFISYLLIQRAHYCFYQQYSTVFYRFQRFHTFLPFRDSILSQLFRDFGQQLQARLTPQSRQIENNLLESSSFLQLAQIGLVLQLEQYTLEKGCGGLEEVEYSLKCTNNLSKDKQKQIKTVLHMEGYDQIASWQSKTKYK